MSDDTANITLTITKEDGQFQVDDLNVPGSPPVGRGRTINEAIGSWLHSNQTRLGISFNTDAVPKEIDAFQKRQLRKR